MIPKYKLAARIADHMRYKLGYKHEDVIKMIIKRGLAQDAGEADALLYDADIAADTTGRSTL